MASNKSKARKLEGRIEATVIKPRFQITLFLLIFGLFALRVTFYALKVRSDLDAYVMPRVLTSDQANKLKRLLIQETSIFSLYRSGTERSRSFRVRI